MLSEGPHKLKIADHSFEKIQGLECRFHEVLLSLGLPWKSFVYQILLRAAGLFMSIGNETDLEVSSLFACVQGHKLRLIHAYLNRNNVQIALNYLLFSTKISENVLRSFICNVIAAS